MHTLYDARPTNQPRQTGARSGARFVQLATLAFWAPCLSVDLFVLWRWNAKAEAFSFVFWTLFREALVYLALWLLIGGFQAILFSRSRREPEPRRRSRRSDSDDASVLSTTREHRGR